MRSAIPNLHPRHLPFALATRVVDGLVDSAIHLADEVAGDKISIMGWALPATSTDMYASQATCCVSKADDVGSRMTRPLPASACS